MTRLGLWFMLFNHPASSVSGILCPSDFPAYAPQTPPRAWCWRQSPACLRGSSQGTTDVGPLEILNLSIFQENPSKAIPISWRISDPLQIQLVRCVFLYVDPSYARQNQFATHSTPRLAQKWACNTPMIKGFVAGTGTIMIPM